MVGRVKVIDSGRWCQEGEVAVEWVFESDY